MQTRSSDDNSVCLSDRLSVSVKRVDCDKTEEISVQIFILGLYERSFSPDFRE